MHPAVSQDQIESSPVLSSDCQVLPESWGQGWGHLWSQLCGFSLHWNILHSHISTEGSLWVMCAGDCTLISWRLNLRVKTVLFFHTMYFLSFSSLFSGIWFFHGGGRPSAEIICSGGGVATSATACWCWPTYKKKQELTALQTGTCAFSYAQPRPLTLWFQIHGEHAWKLGGKNMDIFSARISSDIYLTSVNSCFPPY